MKVLRTPSRVFQVLTRPAAGWAALLLIVAVLLSTAAGYETARSQALRSERAGLLRAANVIATIRPALSALQDAERGQFGYLLTGDSQYLTLYQEGLERALHSSQALKALGLEIAAPRGGILHSDHLINTKLEDMRSTQETFRDDGLTGAQLVLSTGASLASMQAAEAWARESIASEQKLFSRQLSRVAGDTRRVAEVAAFDAMVVLALAVFIAILAAQSFYGWESFGRRSGRAQLHRAGYPTETAALPSVDATSDLKDRLVSGAAHDFRALLQVVKTAITVVEQRLRRDDLEVIRYLDMARRSADNAVSCASQLMTFFRPQSAELRAVDVRELLNEMTQLLRLVVGERISVQIICPNEPRLVTADRRQLETAILNLAMNARDAMANGGNLTVEVGCPSAAVYQSLEQFLAPGVSYSTIAVTDTGTGMTKEMLERAFEPFFTSKGRTEGTGLGLAQVQATMRECRGHVQIDSRLKHGTTVTMYLPQPPDARTDCAGGPPRRDQDRLL